MTISPRFFWKGFKLQHTPSGAAGSEPAMKIGREFPRLFIIWFIPDFGGSLRLSIQEFEKSLRVNMPRVYALSHHVYILLES